MNNTITVIAIVVLVILIFNIVSSMAMLDEKTDAQRLWEKIEQVCDLTRGEPQLNEVLLPNGNMGFTITCKKLDRS
jgi:predicted O-methyltransferase YrrM